MHGDSYEDLLLIEETQFRGAKVQVSDITDQYDSIVERRKIILQEAQIKDTKFDR